MRCSYNFTIEMLFNNMIAMYQLAQLREGRIVETLNYVRAINETKQTHLDNITLINPIDANT